MTPWERSFLLDHRVGHLATAGADGSPHVLPVCYALGADDAVYFVCDEKPKRSSPRGLLRLRNLAANPRAAFVVDDYADDWTRLAWVMVRGSAGVVGLAEHVVALSLLRARYPQYGPMDLSYADHPLVRIAPDRVTSWRCSG